ncbi:MAG: GNAT family N-acetyltransferase [Bacteroides sp.]
MSLKLTTYYQGNQVPELPGTNIFHSKELFLVYEATPNYEPILIVGSIDERPVVKLLAVTRKSTRLFPPSFIYRCEIYGIGEYLDDTLDQEEIFDEILEHLTNEMLSKSFLIEFRNLENSLFGYKCFRRNQYFPVNWLRVRNSIHSMKSPMDRISYSRRRQIRKGFKNGAQVIEAKNDEDIIEFSRMLKKNYSGKILKHFPSLLFFQRLVSKTVGIEIGKIFIVRYKNKIIGGSVCIFSGNNAYIWFSGGMKKTYAKQYPGVLAVWKTIEYAHANAYRHVEFLDVGLPFEKHGYRNFVLRFGGKQSSTRRWFRFRWKTLNNLLAKIYL